MRTVWCRCQEHNVCASGMFEDLHIQMALKIVHDDQGQQFQRRVNV
jgi:hypothetical protein